MLKQDVTFLASMMLLLHRENIGILRELKRLDPNNDKKVQRMIDNYIRDAQKNVMNWAELEKPDEKL